ncbi:MAG: menaquinone biosynthesis protein [Proteobacteria bacterium]|nr:menaquinone biosynthesis protein [Pseudomonadota bacterium]MBU1581442.1 menaquinone biosynthesis protein [Pseudomonadota bacterium]MBU2452259.1 menaquinone biosynthesis protein [Pseudomonadota bacterium]MBU2630828.1 menaquinone biosynthesis protein [Pseudomonadota bacterium]
MGKISYVNSFPVYYGLDHGLLPEWLKMVPDVPSVLNRKIITGQIKVSPISAAFYAMNHQELLLLPDLSISCHGRVMSVILASNYAIDDLDGKKVVFSQESASGASFLKMIFHQRKVTPVYQVGDVTDFEKVSKSADAVLVIGDTALIHPWKQSFEQVIDLGQLWYEMTQLPFVFAVWVVRRSFARKNPLVVNEIHQLLLMSKAQGYQHIDAIVEAAKNKLGLEKSIVKEYFELLFCDLDDKKIKAIGIFFDSLLDQGIIKQRPDIRFFNP